MTEVRIECSAQVDGAKPPEAVASRRRDKQLLSIFPDSPPEYPTLAWEEMARAAQSTHVLKPPNLKRHFREVMMVARAVRLNLRDRSTEPRGHRQRGTFIVIHTPAPQHWMPWEFIELVADQSLEDFRSQFTDVAFLLVRLQETSDELVTWLQSTSTLPRSQVNAISSDISYVTLFCDEQDSERARTSGPAFDGEITPAMTKEPHFIVPIRRREWKAADPMDRIWVGRARNNDIVIRHRTVSKCHASLQYNQDRRIYVRDAGSRNATRVNGESTGAKRVEVKPGDRLSFGLTETRLCSAEVLWQVLSG